VNFSLFHQDEETFKLDSSRLVPRFERELLPTLEVSAGYRAQLASVTEVDDSVEQAIGGVRRKGWISGLQLGLRWDRTDARLDPASGQRLVLKALQAGKLWGGDYAFYRLSAEAAQYFSPGLETVLAFRLKLGFADAIGSEDNLPIFERFFAGGQKSVRGYGRRRLGPKSASDDPLGGRSLLEGSVELRRPLPIVEGLGAVIFVDFGQVSLERFDVPVDDLKFSAGPGLTYATPVGPLSLYVGFPFDPPRGDAGWQIHFSIGHFF
jgi:outer membrane protein assembly factor BamA